MREVGPGDLWDIGAWSWWEASRSWTVLASWLGARKVVQARKGDSRRALRKSVAAMPCDTRAEPMDARAEPRVDPDKAPVLQIWTPHPTGRRKHTRPWPLTRPTTAPLARVPDTREDGEHIAGPFSAMRFH